jgi:deoxycytidine triphosphate deaminase
MLVDREIRELIVGGVLAEADEGRVGPVSYDLRNQSFFTAGEELESVTLQPGDSAFVGSVESVLLPNDLTARVMLKNSRIRAGLALAAPLYFPGHHSRVFYRVTNISANEITLDVGHDIAQVVFERLDSAPDVPYSGAFTDEFDFRGLGAYRDVYGSEMRKVERKAEQLENMENRIYGNVVAIMGVFVAIFSLVNLNLSWQASNATVATLVILDLSVVGGMAALVGLLSSVVDMRSAKVLPWVIADVSFAAAIWLLFVANP